MIEFKTVCKNFTLLMENAKSDNKNLFLNSSLELVQNPKEKASFEEIVSALQSRHWKVSEETPEEVDKCIQQLWQQTICLYQDNPSSNLTSIQTLYQSSILEGLLATPSKREEYASKVREHCELLCKKKCLHQIKTILSNPPQDYMPLLLQTLEEKIEQNYRQLLALQAANEYQILKDWSQNHLSQFLAVFIEEEEGKIKEAFPELFKLFLLTQEASVSKKKSKKSSHVQKQLAKTTQKEIPPKALREKLIKIIMHAPDVEISSSEIIKFLCLKNAMNPKNVNFRSFWKVLKSIHSTYDKIESDQRSFVHSQGNFSQKSERFVKLAEKLQNREHLRSNVEKTMESFKEIQNKKSKEMREKSLTHFTIKRSIKTAFLEDGAPHSKLFAEIVLMKMKNSSFFDRTIESSFLQSYIKKFPEGSLYRENDEVNYRNLLQELEKIESKLPISQRENSYKVSLEMQDFFDIIGETRDQIFSLEQYKAPEIPILQPIFNQEEVGAVKEFLQELEKEEKFFWEKMMEILLEHRLELQEEQQKRDAQISHQTPKGKKSEARTPVPQKEPENSTTTAIGITSKNWQKIIPTHKKTTIDLLYPKHVTRWFDNPINSLKDPKYRSLIQDMGKEECLYFHSFPKIIDEFVGTSYSLQNEVYNARTGQNDILYGIPGEFEIKGKKYRGFFQYIIDSKSGTCYHRCFNFRNKNFIEDLIEEKVWYPNHFPTLDQSKNYVGQKIESFLFDGITLQYDSILKKIYVKNEKMKIVLFNNFDNELFSEMFKLLEK